MYYISQSPIHFSKINPKCVLKCTKFSGEKSDSYMFKMNCSSIEHQYKKLIDGFNKKRGQNEFTFPMFDY